MYKEPLAIPNSIIAKIGPSCNTLEKYPKLKGARVCLSRFNMLLSFINDLRKYEQLRNDHNLKVSIDTEVGKMITKRNGMSGLNIDKGEIFRIYDIFFIKISLMVFY